jgi:hypothetical protein
MSDSNSVKNNTEYKEIPQKSSADKGITQDNSFSNTEKTSASEDSLLFTSRTNAITYIEKKYGFTPEIKEFVIMKRSGDMVMPETFPQETGMVRFEMEYEGQKFHTEITGEKESDHGYDDHQEQEILDALKKESSDRL